MGSHFHREPRFQPPPLKFRTSGFPQYGFKHQAPVSSVWSLPDLADRLSRTRACPVSIVGLLHPSEPPTPQIYSVSKDGKSASADPPGPRGPRSARVMLSRASSLVDPIRRSDHLRPISRYSGYSDALWHSRVILPGRQTFRTFTAVLSRIAALSFRRETRCVHASVLAHRRWPSDRRGKPLASPNIPQIRFTREAAFDG